MKNFSKVALLLIISLSLTSCSFKELIFTEEELLEDKEKMIEQGLLPKPAEQQLFEDMAVQTMQIDDIQDRVNTMRKVIENNPDKIEKNGDSYENRIERLVDKIDEGKIDIDSTEPSQEVLDSLIK